MNTALLLCLLISVIGPSLAVDNGLGRVPQMAWNSWNAIGCDINEDLIKGMAKALISTGLADVGYEYINMDDCWALNRNASGFIQPDPTDFPSGIAALAEYVHSLGLKFGLYSDAGSNTCGGRPGSLGYETEDATQYAAWKVDYLKYDNCYNEGLPDLGRYTTMRDALNKTGRPIFFSLCDWVSTTAAWGPEVGNSWRTTTDIWANWDSWTANLDQNNYIAQYAAPGGWNDPDMLEVGNGLPPAENVAHYSLWALIKAPMILGNDLTKMTSDVLSILTNKEVIAVSQDPLGKQGYRIVHNLSTNSSLYSNVIYADVCQPGLKAQQWTYTSAGLIQSQWISNQCIGTYQRSFSPCPPAATAGAPLFLQQCNAGPCNGTGQSFDFTSSGTLQTNFKTSNPLCIEIVPNTEHEVQLSWTNCTNPSTTQKWSYSSSTGQIQNGNGECLTIGGGQEVWAAPMSDGSTVVVLFNRAAYAQRVTVMWSNIGFSGSCNVRDLWLHQNMGAFASGYSAMVESHGVVMIKVTKA